MEDPKAPRTRSKVFRKDKRSEERDKRQAAKHPLKEMKIVLILKMMKMTELDSQKVVSLKKMNLEMKKR